MSAGGLILTINESKTKSEPKLDNKQLRWKYYVLHYTIWSEPTFAWRTQNRERERSKSFVISPQTWLTERQWQHLSSANCWAGHSGREGRMGEARWWEYGKTLPTIVLQPFWHHLYLSPATHLTTATRTWWKVFLPRVIILSFPNICFLSDY